MGFFGNFICNVIESTGNFVLSSGDKIVDRIDRSLGKIGGGIDNICDTARNVKDKRRVDLEDLTDTARNVRDIADGANDLRTIIPRGRS